MHVFSRNSFDRSTVCVLKVLTTYVLPNNLNCLQICTNYMMNVLLFKANGLWFMLIGHSGTYIVALRLRHTVLVCGRISVSWCFQQLITAFPKTRSVLRPRWEIGGVLAAGGDCGWGGVVEFYNNIMMSWQKWKMKARNEKDKRGLSEQTLLYFCNITINRCPLQSLTVTCFMARGTGDFYW